MLDRTALHVALGVGGLHVVVHQLAGDAGDATHATLGDGARHLEEVDAAVVQRVARGEVGHGHGHIDPCANLRSTRVGLVLVAGQRIGAIGVDAVLQRDGGQAAHVVHEGPHREVAGHGLRLVLVGRAEIQAARIPWPALWKPDRGTGAIERAAADRAHGGGVRLVARDGGLHLHVERGAVVHVARVQRAQEEVPCLLAGATGCHRTQHMAHAHGQAGVGLDLLGGVDQILACRDHRPVADVLGPAVVHVHVAAGVHGRPVPVQELRRAEVAVGVHPRAVLNMHDIVRGHGPVVQVLLHHGGHVARRVCLRHDVGHRLHVVAVAAAPGVVAVVGQHGQHRAIRRVLRLQRVQLRGGQRVVAVKPAQALRAGHHDHAALRAGGGVHVLGAVRRERHRHRFGGCAAATDAEAEPVGAVRVQLIGLVRWIAVHAAAAQLQRKVRTRATDLLAAHEGPLDAGFLQQRNDALAEGHLAREEALRDRRRGAERLGVDLLVQRQFLADGGVVHQRQQRMMEAELHDVHARHVGAAGRGGPVACLAPAAVPVGAVAELAARFGETLDVLDQSAAEAHLRAGFGAPADAVHAVARSVLVRGHAIIQSEDGAEIVRRVCGATITSLDALPGALVARAVGIGPVDGLLHVPQPGQVQLFGGRRCRAGQAGKQGQLARVGSHRVFNITRRRELPRGC